MPFVRGEEPRPCPAWRSCPCAWREEEPPSPSPWKSRRPPLEMSLLPSPSMSLLPSLSIWLQELPQSTPTARGGSEVRGTHWGGRTGREQGDTAVVAVVYGPKLGTRKGENPEKASIDVVWKPKTGQIGRQEKEYAMTLKRTLQSICLLTTTSVILQLRLAAGVLENGDVILDTSKAKEKQLKSFAHLVFPNSSKSVDLKESQQKDGHSERGLITLITHGVMSGFLITLDSLLRAGKLPMSTANILFLSSILFVSMYV